MVSAGLLGRAVTRQRMRALDKERRCEGAVWVLTFMVGIETFMASVGVSLSLLICLLQ